MVRRKSIPKSQETQILLLSRRRCALCFGLRHVQAVCKGQIAHLDRDPSNNSVDNLVYLCLPDHDDYDSTTSQSKGYTPQEVRQYRDELYIFLGPTQVPQPNAVPHISSRTAPLDQEFLSNLWEDIYSLVWGGFVPDDQIVSAILEMYADERDPYLLNPFVSAISVGLLDEHKRQQTNWPAITDCDRLDSAFAELETLGIVCRQDFADCLSCGYREIWGEIETEEQKGRTIRGFTFFHMQVTDAAVREGDIYLGYGSVLDPESADIAIGHEIVGVIRNHGLTVNWDGTIAHRIEVKMQWLRRR